MSYLWAWRHDTGCLVKSEISLVFFQPLYLLFKLDPSLLKPLILRWLKQEVEGQLCLAMFVPSTRKLLVNLHNLHSLFIIVHFLLQVLPPSSTIPSWTFDRRTSAEQGVR